MANTKKSTDNKNKKNKNTKKSGNSKANTVKEDIVKKDEEKIEKEEKVVEEDVIETVNDDEDREVTVQKDNNNVLKGIIILLGLIIFFIIIFLISNQSDKGVYSNTGGTTSGSTVDVSQESSDIPEEEMGELTSIDISKYLELKEGDSYSVIYIGRPTCSHCQVQLPIMKHLVYKYGVTVNYLNTDDLDEDGISKLQESDDYFKEGWGTPLVLIVKDDEIVDKIEGESSIDDTASLLKKYDLISEEKE